MASSVDIANLALSNLGDSATVTSIDPPEGSAQAEHCARFYPIALVSMLEMHTWTFSARRAALAAVANPSTTWSYAYAKPSQCLGIVAIIDPAATDDYSYSTGSYATGSYTPQQFVVERDADGYAIILTNLASAVLRYKALVTDTSKFKALFTQAFSWLLASHLAGPVIKGADGRAAAKECLSTFAYWMARAQMADASDQKVDVEHQVEWMVNR